MKLNPNRILPTTLCLVFGWAICGCDQNPRISSGDSTATPPSTSVADSTNEECRCSEQCDACANGEDSKCKCESDSILNQASFNNEKSPDSGASVDETGNTQPNTLAQDRDIFHFLLQNHEKLSRTVTEMENGVVTVTESSDADITKKIQEHVASMYSRVDTGRRIRMWDSLYQEVFKHADKIEMKLENTETGIKVTETSDDEYVVKLIKAHAKVVSGFVEHGYEEARKNHDPPR